LKAFGNSPFPEPGPITGRFFNHILTKGHPALGELQNAIHQDKRKLTPVRRNYPSVGKAISILDNEGKNKPPS
jgi:hypothetical protein